MKTVGKKVIIKKVDGEERSASGLITVTLTQNKGKVLAVGPEATGVKLDDSVIYTGTGYGQVTVAGETLLILDEASILVVL